MNGIPTTPESVKEVIPVLAMEAEHVAASLKNTRDVCLKLNANSIPFNRELLFFTIANCAVVYNGCIVPISYIDTGDAKEKTRNFKSIRQIRLPVAVSGEKRTSNKAKTSSFNNIIVRAAGYLIQDQFDHVSRHTACGNDSCINPRHLTIKMQVDDNMADEEGDKVSKKAGKKGKKGKKTGKTTSHEVTERKTVVSTFQLSSVEEAFIDQVINARK
jgi:hypothetical protein